MLRSQLNDALKKAVLAKDACSVTTVRLILAALKERDIAARSDGNTDGISDDEIISLLQAMVKQRRESIEMYTKGNRPELAEQEAKEIEVIEEFLPRKLDDKEVSAAIDAAVAEVGASSIRDMGKVMGALKARHTGQMDFGAVGSQVKARLAQG